MVKEFLRIISKTVYVIKSIFIFTFSLLSFFGVHKVNVEL